MDKITIVTGNPGKLRELEAMAEGKLHFRMHALDLPEIQSLDMREIVTDKLMRAYQELRCPIIVDDVSAGLTSLEGLPGPFIKFFHERLGDDALLKLARGESDKVTITCIAAYYDGESMLFGEGTIEGAVTPPRGKNGFGFDSVIVPAGESRTMAEMSAKEKMAVSHRGKAFRALLEQLEQTK